MPEYLSHFGLTKAPFSTTPDPAFAYATREHKQALAKVAYYTEERRGIFLLMGEIGTGSGLRAGDQRAAAEERERAAGARPATALDFFLSGLEGWLHGQFDQAAQACEEALQRQPDHFWAQYLLALCRLKNRQWGEARVGLSACLGRRPHVLWPRLFRATALAELGQA